MGVVALVVCSGSLLVDLYTLEFNTLCNSVIFQLNCLGNQLSIFLSDFSCSLCFYCGNLLRAILLKILKSKSFRLDACKNDGGVFHFCRFLYIQ